MTPLFEQSDEELCVLASAGDRQAEECLVGRYTRLVRICARPFFLAGGDSEDLIQEGMIGLLSAVRGFSAEKDSRFRTYAESCIRNRMISAIRSAQREKHAPLNSSLSLDVSPFEEEGCTYGSPSFPHSENPEDLFIVREERKNRLDALRSKLSSFEREVLEHYLDGCSCAEIGALTGKSPKAADNAVQRIRRKAAPFFSFGDISKS